MDVGSNRRKGLGGRPAGSRGRRSAVAGEVESPASRSGSSSEKGSTTALASHPTENLSLTFASTLAEGHIVQKQILAAAERAGYKGEDFFALRIAMEEALINAIKHGNRLDASKTVHIEARVEPGRIEMTVEDQGVGFDRSCVPDPTAEENLHKCSGRGILLIESYMSEVRWDRGGRRLHMVRERKA